MSLPSEAASASKARRFIRDALAQSDAQAFEESAVLLASELVTNAVLHTHTAPELIVRLDSGRLWVGVHDGSQVSPTPKRYGPQAATGRGLQLVERVAARWGFQTDDSGKVVWFEIDEDSNTRYAQAQDEALLDGFAAIELGLGYSLEATVPTRSDQQPPDMAGMRLHQKALGQWRLVKT